MNYKAKLKAEYEKQRKIGHEMYQLIDCSGNGELVVKMRDALKTRDFANIDTCIQEKVPQYLYNNGVGENVSCIRKVLIV